MSTRGRDRQTARRSGLAALVALGALSCPADPPARDDRGWSPIDSSVDARRDRAVKIIGARCAPASTAVLYEDSAENVGWFPRLSWAGDQYGVVWSQTASASKANVAFARVSADGKAMGAVTFLTQQPTVTQGAGPEVAIAGLEKGFAVLWADSRAAADKSDLYLALLDAAGKPLDGGKVCTTAGCGQKRVTTSERATSPYVVRPSYIDVDTRPTSSLAVAWRDGRSLQAIPYPPYQTGRSDIFYKVLDVNGTDKLLERRITTDASKSAPRWPVMAYDGDHFAVAWMHSLSGDSELFYVFLRESGAILLPEQSLALSKGAFATSPDIAWAGAEYGIVFSSNVSSAAGTIAFSRVARASGAVLGVQHVTEADAPCTPAVAFNGERYALVWQDKCGEEGSRLVFALIDDAGSPIQPDGKSCAGSVDPRCGLVVVSPSSVGTAAFPNMISVQGALAVTWMNAPQHRIYFSRIVCTR